MGNEHKRRFPKASRTIVNGTRPSVPVTNHDGDVRRLDEIEADLIQLALSINGGSIADAARRLGIGRSTLYRKLEAQGWFAP